MWKPAVYLNCALMAHVYIQSPYTPPAPTPDSKPRKMPLIDLFIFYKTVWLSVSLTVCLIHFVFPFSSFLPF